MTLKIKGLKEFEKKLDSLRLKYNNTKPIAFAIGVEFKKNIKNLFETKNNPFGVPWIQSRNPDTLVDTGDLRDSGDFKALNNEVVITWGNGLDYARFHNDGIGQKRRQFVPNRGKLPKKWNEQAKKIIRKELFKDL